MRHVVSFAMLAMVIAAMACACHSAVYSPFDEGFDACDDPRITKSQRLTIHESAEIQQRLQSPAVGRASTENRVESAREATALFANSWVTNGYEQPGLYGTGPDASRDHASIDAFVNATDFAHDELVFMRETVTGSDGYAGTMSSHGRTAIVAHRCGAMGGAVPPTASWVAVYRIPRGNVVSEVDCEPCPVFVCCPP